MPTLVQGDTAPTLNATLTEKGTDIPINLSGSSVKFQMRKFDDRKYTVDAAAQIVTPTAGTVRYSLATNDLAVAGDYIVQWEITFSDNTIQTTEYVNVKVRRQ